jgi:N-dimethylarginine dimethylaminohydrolase
MPHLLMSPPDYFEVSYSINPWMDPAQWSVDAKRLCKDAHDGWLALKSTYEALGAKVTVKPAAKGWPDLVFTANCAVVLDRKAVMARYLRPERTGEEPHGLRMFESLLAKGVIDTIAHMPAGVYFEGAGDAIHDPERHLIWTGWGQRSSLEASDTLARVFSLRTVPLELIDPRFYHLDTCFCLLSGGEVVYHPPAFSEEGRAQILAHVPPGKLIAAPLEDAEHLGVNSVCIGNDVVMCWCTPTLRAELESRGYRVHVVPLGSFNRSGGAAYCLTLRLDGKSSACKTGNAAASA